MPHGGGGAEVDEDGHEVGAGADVPVEDAVDLAVNAAVDRVDQAVALAVAGIGEKVLERMRSPPGVKTTSTGLSMPPVMTCSIPVPSGRQRKMCDALVTKGGLPGRS